MIFEAGRNRRRILFRGTGKKPGAVWACLRWQETGRIRPDLKGGGRYG
jgi:hypothetical protein